MTQPIERPTRRAVVLGLICAPAIVRATSLMPVRAWVEPPVGGIILAEWAARIRPGGADEIVTLLTQTNLVMKDMWVNMSWRPITYMEFYRDR